MLLPTGLPSVGFILRLKLSHPGCDNPGHIAASGSGREALLVIVQSLIGISFSAGNFGQALISSCRVWALSEFFEVETVIGPIRLETHSDTLDFRNCAC
jgi:hypothetical protein